MRKVVSKSNLLYRFLCKFYTFPYLEKVTFHSISYPKDFVSSCRLSLCQLLSSSGQLQLVGSWSLADFNILKI